MRSVFSEVWRVLRDDGTLWLNLGDSYAGGGNYRGVNSLDTLTDKQRSNRGARGLSQELGGKVPDGLKPKDLVGIPWRVAFALQADGWYLRSDIIWAKPNPMPESVTDRPTKAHEYLFLFSKNQRYYYDADSIREPYSDNRPWGVIGDIEKDYHGGLLNKRFDYSNSGRNRRSVWTIQTSPYPEAHFATFPPNLIKPCILAGCAIGGTVLDPFAGSGTTGMVAIELGRKAILIELNPDYVKLAKDRCNVTPGLPLPC